MSIEFASLNSGSNGNCYYVGNQEEAVLIDAGLSCKEIEKRMKQVNISMKKVKAVFISHEHIDHVKGIEVLSKKYDLPVYISAKTKTNCRTPIPSNLIKGFFTNEIYTIGQLQITSFSKSHDAVDPCSFVVSSSNYHVGVFTDIGHVCEKVKTHFSKCHAVFLEANYDEQMLENGSYPYHLKKRITSDEGHLSNNQAMELFLNHRSPQLSHLLLSHLSKENNCPDLVSNFFKKNTTNTEIIVASRYEPSKLYRIGQSIHHQYVSNNPVQMQLFG